MDTIVYFLYLFNNKRLKSMLWDLGLSIESRGLRSDICPDFHVGVCVCVCVFTYMVQ